jgi:hypothetical protein
MDDRADAESRWRFDRALARVERAVDELLAEYAASYVLRPVHRHADVVRGVVTWSIDKETVVEFFHVQHGHDRLVVHDVALLGPLRKRVRSRHVDVEHVLARA